MLLAEAGCVFMGFVLYISGVQGQQHSICALKGSSVQLSCSAKHPTSSMKWYSVNENGPTVELKELSADENRVTYNMSKQSNFTLTIKDLRESDAKHYCCSENSDQTENCKHSTIQLRAADLQVKVIPTTEGQTVTLMCSTSCPLTEKPVTYIWYKNRELLYRDSSPWYQQLVSSDEAVTYSCAVKGHVDLRAPEVSVDSVTSTCINVTYAKGTMCSSKQTSVDEPCSITYPTEIHVQRTEDTADHVRLTCKTSCPVTDFTWYTNKQVDTKYQKSHFAVTITTAESFSCAVKDHKDLYSAEVCTDDRNCWSVNYVSRRICALQGLSVNISSEYSHPHNQQPKSKSWYKIVKENNNSDKEDAEKLEEARRVKYHDNMKNLHNLTINNLKKNDSAEYTFSLQKDDEGWKPSALPGVTLVVTGLTLKFTPSAEVTEGQRVTLTCQTSCPLTDDTNYIWYLNSRPLTLPENQHKHLVLDPVSSQHAGNYYCAVKTHNIRSHEKTLTVHSETNWTPAAAAGVGAALLILIPVTVLLWMRRKRTSSQSQSTETPTNMEQQNPDPMYDEISDLPAKQDDIYYSEVHFPRDHTAPVYSTVQPHQPQEQEPSHYAVVSFNPNTT